MSDSIFKNVELEQYSTINRATVKSTPIEVTTLTSTDIYEVDYLGLESDIDIGVVDLKKVGRQLTIAQMIDGLEGDQTLNDKAFLTSILSISNEAKPSKVKPQATNFKDVREVSGIEKFVMKAWNLLLSLLGNIKRMLVNLWRSLRNATNLIPEIIKRIEGSSRETYRIPKNELYANEGSLASNGKLSVNEADCERPWVSIHTAETDLKDIVSITDSVADLFIKGSNMKSVDGLDGIFNNIEDIINSRPKEPNRITSILGVAMDLSVSTDGFAETYPTANKKYQSEIDITKAEFLELIKALDSFTAILDLPKRDSLLTNLLKSTKAYRTRDGIYSPTFHGAMSKFTNQFYVKFIGQLTTNLNLYIRLLDHASKGG